MNLEFPPGMLVGYELEFCSKAMLAGRPMEHLNEWFQLGTDASLEPRDAAYTYEIRSRTPMNVVSVDVIALMLDHLNLVAQRDLLGTSRPRPSRPQPSLRPPRQSAFTVHSVYFDVATPTTSTSIISPTVPVSVTSTATTNTRDWWSTSRLADFETSEPPPEADYDPRPGPTKNREVLFTTRKCGLHVHVSWTPKLAHIFFGHLVQVLTKRVKPFEERRLYCDPEFTSPRGPRYNALRWVEVGSHFEARIFNGTMKLRGIVQALQMIRNEALLVARASQAA